MLVCYLKSLMVRYMNEAELIEIIKREIAKHYLLTEKSSDIYILGNDSIIKEELEKKFKISSESEKVIVTDLDINDLVNLSQGSYGTDRSKELLNILLEGKEIFLIEEGIYWRKFKSIPVELEKKYLEYEEQLKKYGMKIVRKLELLDELESKKKYYLGNVLDVKQLKLNVDSLEKKIIVSSKTKITELAKEYASINNIEIIKR